MSRVRPLNPSERPHVLDFRTDATVGPLTCSRGCRLCYDREPSCRGANRYGSQRFELRLLLRSGLAYLQQAGFTVKTIETAYLQPIKMRLGVPNDLAACHTAQIGGYVIEGHVPAAALKRFLNDKPSAIGLAVPGMPVGSPGMEEGSAEPYEVVMFGPAGRRTYMRFVGYVHSEYPCVRLQLVCYKDRNLVD